MDSNEQTSAATETAAVETPPAIEASRDELQQGWDRLNAARRQFEEEQATRETDWKNRCDAAWERLRHETAKVAGEKQMTLRMRRHANTEIEISRRQLEASWSQLRREQQEWRERRAQEETGLQDQQSRLDKERQELQQAKDAWTQQAAADEKVRLTRLAEVDGLERRIQNYCTKLAELRTEANRLEETLDVDGQVQLLPDAIEPVLQAIALPDGPEDVLAFLTETAHDLVDQSQHMIDLHQKLLRLRDVWRAEWDQALAAVAQAEDEQRQRDRTMAAQEEQLERREMFMRQQLADVARRQQECQCWEARLARRQSALEAERGRLSATVKVHVTAAREQRQLLLRLYEAWDQRRQDELARQQELCQSREEARADYLRHRDALRQRILELDERQRDLEERDFVLTVAKHQLLANDPNPVAAGKELQRRLDHLQRIVRKPLRGLEKYEADLEKRAEQLEDFREQLLLDQENLQREQVACAALQTSLEADQTNMAEERLRWATELQAVGQDRLRLVRQVQELEEQLDRLTLAIMGTQRPQPALAMAA